MCGKILKQTIITVCLLLWLSSCCVQVSADGGTTNQSRAKADYHDVNSGLERIEDRMQPGRNWT